MVGSFRFTRWELEVGGWELACRRLLPRRTSILCAAALTFLAACSSPRPEATRASGPLEAIGPKGEVRWPVTFSWKGSSPESVVRIRIFDEAERQVFGIEARGSARTAPDELRAILGAGAPYQWRVARVDANGEEADASALTAFSVR